MAILSIDFQSGFINDTIVLLVNDEEVFHKEHVNTKLLLGLADSFKTEIETGLVSIEIHVLTKDIKKALVLEVLEDKYIGISIVNSMVDYIVTDEPFGYG